MVVVAVSSSGNGGSEDSVFGGSDGGEGGGDVVGSGAWPFARDSIGSTLAPPPTEMEEGLPGASRATPAGK